MQYDEEFREAKTGRQDIYAAWLIFLAVVAGFLLMAASGLLGPHEAQWATPQQDRSTAEHRPKPDRLIMRNSETRAQRLVRLSLSRRPSSRDR